MQDIAKLDHVIKPLYNGGKILILDNGAVITPEAEAMLQAMHSRSVGGVEEHLKKISDIGVKRFMETFYVGYGHKSIGDCGTGTIFVEGVSMLAAKAIQDWPLYSGQESSTRYIDFSTQPFMDPIGTDDSKTILENWREFYCSGIEKLKEDLIRRFPINDGENESVYEKAIAARSFDIMRGFLPAGATTNLAWHTNLRQMADEISVLRHHPLYEVKMIAEAIEDGLLEMFPSSFSEKRYSDTEEYVSYWMENNYYFQNENHPDFMVTDLIIYPSIVENSEILSKRPPKTELPRFINECGQIQFDFLLDFGSFRDIQRHRAVSQRMPLVTTEHGFNDWYLEELSLDLFKEAHSLIDKQLKLLSSLDSATPEEKQYYIAMGYNLPNRVTGSLPALVYLVELRSTRFVHPTLRHRAIQMGEHLQGMFSFCDMKIHFDEEPDRFDIKRGEHDISVG